MTTNKQARPVVKPDLLFFKFFVVVVFFIVCMCSMNRTRRLRHLLEDDDLLDYKKNHNLCEIYCRWDPALKIKFNFWDTIGDVRFISGILECMKQSQVIVALYRLSYDKQQVEKSVNFIVKIDRLIHSMLLKSSKQSKSNQSETGSEYPHPPHQTSFGVRAMCAEDFEIPDQYNVKFGCMVVGISTQPLFSHGLRDKHFETLQYLKRKCIHLKFIKSHAFHINYHMPGMPRAVTLLETLVDIGEMKKNSSVFGYIRNIQTWADCGLIKRNKSLYKFPPKMFGKSTTNWELATRTPDTLVSADTIRIVPGPVTSVEYCSVVSFA